MSGAQERRSISPRKGHATVIVSYINSERTLGRCLELLRAQDYRNFEVEAIDGGPSHLTEAQGQIKGIKEADSDYIAFTNSDCFVPARWLSRMISILEGGADIVLGRTMRGGDIYSYAWNTPQAVLNRQSSGLGYGFSNCVVKKEVFWQVPLRNLKASQDADFLIRARRLGKRIAVDPSITVYHDHPLKSLPQSMRKMLLASENYTYLLKKNLGSVVGSSDLGLQAAFFRYLRGFFTPGGMPPVYASLPEYALVRLVTKVAQVCGFCLGVLRDGIVDAH